MANPNLNTVIVSGILTRAPERRTFNNGGSVINFGIGFLESKWFDQKEKKMKYKNGFLDVKKNLSGEYANEQAQKLEQLEKGMHVVIEGHLGFEEWESKDGGKRTRVLLVARTITPLSADRSSASSSRQEQRSNRRDDAPPPDDDDGGYGDRGRNEIPF